MKLIIFDLDGVLVDSCDLHYHALNLALATVDKKYVINISEHNTIYNGLPTTTKLVKLTEHKGFPKELHDSVSKLKQIYTIELINSLKPDTRIAQILGSLKNSGYFLACASNSIRKTVELLLEKKGLISYFDFLISNEEVNFPKPNPEIYLRCMIHFGVSPSETAIVEDSPIGRKGAISSGATLIPVENSNDLTLELISRYIPKSAPQFNVVIPMAGLGSRFSEKGYIFPKPLIEINGKPMIQVVVENLNCPEGTQFIFIVSKDHLKYNLKETLNVISPGCKIVIVDSLTEGAACTILLAKEFINNDSPLMLANCDQYVEFDTTEFINSSMNYDGSIQIFENCHPKWSYAKVENGLVTEVAEKKPISNNATTGIYFWKKGTNFVKYAERMISKNIRVNNEFYTCPVFNEAIQDSLKIGIVPCKKMWGLGVPNDLEYFIANFKN